MKYKNNFRKTERVPVNVVADPKYGSVGWRTSIDIERRNFNLKINRIIAKGIGLKKGSIVYCYLSKDKGNRKVITVYLDGKSKNKTAKLK